MMKYVVYALRSSHRLLPGWLGLSMLVGSMACSAHRKDGAAVLTAGIQVGDNISTIAKHIAASSNVTIDAVIGLPITECASTPFLVLYTVDDSKVLSVALVGPSSYDFTPIRRKVPDAVLKDAFVLRDAISKAVGSPPDFGQDSRVFSDSINSTETDVIFASWSRTDAPPITVSVSIADDGWSCHATAAIGTATSDGRRAALAPSHPILRLRGPVGSKARVPSRISGTDGAPSVSDIPVAVVGGVYLSGSQGESVLRCSEGATMIDFGGTLLCRATDDDDVLRHIIEPATGSASQVATNRVILDEMFVGSLDGETAQYSMTGYGAVATNLLADGYVQTVTALINGVFHFERHDASDYKLDYHYYWEIGANARHDAIRTEAGKAMEPITFAGLRCRRIWGKTPEGEYTNRVFHVARAGRLQYNDIRKEFSLQDAEVTHVGGRKCMHSLWSN